MQAVVLTSRIAFLEGEKRRHKAAIKRHKEQLQLAAAELTRLEAKCARRGLSVHITEGEEETHGQPQRARA